MRETIDVQQVSLTKDNNIECLTVNLEKKSVTSVYKPSAQSLPSIRKSLKIVVGDSNSHSTSWRCAEDDDDGKLVEQCPASTHSH